MTSKVWGILVGLGVLTLATVSQAASCDPLSVFNSCQVQTDPGTLQIATSPLNDLSTGTTMAGLSVTAFFSTGGSETVSWEATTSGAGGVSGSSWSLTVGGDTLGAFGAWSLNTSGEGLSGLLIDAGPGNTVFDIDPEGDDFSGAGNLGTLGSGKGLTLTLTGGPANLDILATYVDGVSLDGAPAVGDLFRTLEITFATGLPVGSTVTYFADTDSVLSLAPIPEPSSILLFGTGFGVMLGYAWRRQRRIREIPSAG